VLPKHVVESATPVCAERFRVSSLARCRLNAGCVFAVGVAIANLEPHNFDIS